MPTLLVVDDSDVDRTLVGGILQSGIQGGEVEFAEDGVQAIEKMAAAEPDLVITDMQMPNRDGLQLVSAIRVQHPSVPVILITAHGSEDLAVEALHQGAASYVPKAQLNDRLVDTAQDVLSLSQSDQSYERLMGCLGGSEFHFELENDPNLVGPLVDLLQQIVTGMSLCDPTGGFRLGIAVREAVMNAIYHGNLELTPEQYANKEERERIATERLSDDSFAAKKIHVDALLNEESAVFIVRDAGTGFPAVEALAAANVDSNGSTTGRGLVLMQSFCDSVTYNETGNEVTLKAMREGA